jgi:hypothetical protein
MNKNKISDNLINVRIFQDSYKIPLFGKFPSLIKKEFRSKYNLPVSGYNELSHKLKYITYKNIKDENGKVIDQEIISNDNKYKYGITNYGFITGSKNGVIVLDLDLYPKPDEITKGVTSLWQRDGNNHPFIQHYIKHYDIEPSQNWIDTVYLIIEKINTFTVKTPNKGFHLYFKYSNNDLRNTQDKNLGVDIRGDGGYVVGCGSKLQAGEYTPFRNVEIQDLCSHDKDYFYNVYATTPTGKINTVLKEKLIKKKNVKDTPRDLSLWKYEMNDDIFNKILYKLKKQSSEYFNKDDPKYTYKNWLKITTFLKVFDKKDIWESFNTKYSNGIDYHEKNNSSWECIDKSAMNKYDTCICQSILKSLDLYYLLSAIKYRPLLSNIAKPDVIVDSENTKGLSQVFQIQPNNNYVIKSRTNSGKTYLVNDYHHNLEVFKPLLSITSRVSLAEEHQRVFVRANKINCDMNYNLYCEGKNRKESLYKYEGENLIIQLDSLDRISNYDFSNYIVFVDELQSVFEYLDTSPTFEKKKNKIQKLFKRILKTCHQFIGVDADIQDTVLEYLNPAKYISDCNKNFILASPELDFKFIDNLYHPYKNVEAEEITNYDTLVDLLSKEDQFMVCSDSQKECHNLKNKLKLVQNKSDDDFQIKVIDRVYNGSMNLDDLDQVMFSPKIIYGLDSIKRRKVFCLFKGHTITAKAMLQQVSRCRNIEKLYFYFMDSTTICKPFEFNSPNDVIDRITYLNDYGKKYKIDIPDIHDDDISPSELFYNYRMSKHLYNFDSDRTNKKLHFIKGLQSMQIKILSSGILKVKPVKPSDKKQLNEMTKKDMLKHFIDNYVNKDGEKDEYYTRINEVLRIPDSQLLDNQELFTNPMSLTHHFNFINIFSNKESESINKVKDLINETYNINIVWSDDAKVVWLKKQLDTLGINLLESGLKINTPFSKENSVRIEAEYKSLFRDRRVKVDFKIDKEITKILCKVIGELIGDDNNKEVFKVTRKDIIINNIRKTWNDYQLNNDFVKKHELIRDYRSSIKLDEYAFDTDDDDEIDDLDYINPLDIL